MIRRCGLNDLQNNNWRFYIKRWSVNLEHTLKILQRIFCNKSWWNVWESTAMLLNHIIQCNFFRVIKMFKFILKLGQIHKCVRCWVSFLVFVLLWLLLSMTTTSPLKRVKICCLPYKNKFSFDIKWSIFMWWGDKADMDRLLLIGLPKLKKSKRRFLIIVPICWIWLCQ